MPTKPVGGENGCPKSMVTLTESRGVFAELTACIGQSKFLTGLIIAAPRIRLTRREWEWSALRDRTKWVDEYKKKIVTC